MSYIRRNIVQCDVIKMLSVSVVKASELWLTVERLFTNIASKSISCMNVVYHIH